MRIPSKSVTRSLLVSSFMALSLSGCQAVKSVYYDDKHVEWDYVKPDEQPVLKAIGYAPISAQNGQTETIRMLNAIKASKLDAYKELAEQVYGQRVDTNQSLANLVLSDNHLEASVEGVIRGAEVVKSYPVGEDVYATELTLDFQKVYDLYLASARPKKVKEVRYY